jgi:hypothetical protein
MYDIKYVICAAEKAASEIRGESRDGEIGF